MNATEYLASLRTIQVTLCYPGHDQIHCVNLYIIDQSKRIGIASQEHGSPSNVRFHIPRGAVVKYSDSNSVESYVDALGKLVLL